MESNRKAWNEQQQKLNRAVLHARDHAPAVELFLEQHAMVHCAAVSGVERVSFEDEVWQDLSEEEARCIPRGFEHSIAWMLWHTARIEDVTMNLLAAGSSQLLNSAGWKERLQASAADTGNGMTPEEVRRLSDEIHVEALRGYRLAVGQRTRELVRGWAPGRLQEPVAPRDLERALAEGAVLPRAADLLEYWGGKTIGGLLLMPPTRHALVHLNEAMRLKARLG